MSSSQAATIAFILKNWQEFSGNDREQLETEYPSLKYFFSWLKNKSNDAAEKVASKNIPNAIGALGSDIKEMMDQKIKEGGERMRKSLQKAADAIYNDRKTLSNEEFGEKYYEKVRGFRGKEYYSPSKFLKSKNGIILQNKLNGTLDTMITDAIKIYVRAEHDKIDSMVYKLNSKLGSRIINYDLGKLTNRTVNGEFTILLTLDDDTKVKVETDVIYAGGYNIQVLHLRWLMKFTLDGKRYEIQNK